MKKSYHQSQQINKMTRFAQNLLQHKQLLFLVILLGVFIILRFSMLFERANLGWDQIDSAWAAKSILVDKHFLINGPVAKGNSGIYMGPLYYYLITPFYFFTNLDPIASPVFQGVMSVVNVLILFFVTKKLFGTKMAYLTAFISTFSMISMTADRVQSAYYFIVPISYLIFYALYKVLLGKEKYLLLLAIFLGLSFHVDFTSVFYPIIILFTLPFFPRTRRTLYYFLFSIPILLIFLLPSIMSDLSVKHATTGSMFILFHTSYHGIHLKRVLQIISDAFISFEQILEFNFLRYGAYLVFPIFIVLYYRSHGKKESLLLFYMIGLWILIPWIVLSAYSGELTDYYFSLPRDLAMAMLAFISLYLFTKKKLVLKALPFVFWGIYVFYGIQYFFNFPSGNLLGFEHSVRAAVKSGIYIPFQDHHAESYLYYIYTRKK